MVFTKKSGDGMGETRMALEATADEMTGADPRSGGSQ
jgi:hypothetical protein